MLIADTRYPVYLREPMNRKHPLNVGRLAWWLGLPGLDGGRTWWDICGQYHGTLTNMANTTNGWRSSSRPGGRSAVLCDGTAGFVDTSNIAGANNCAQLTVAMWVNQTAAVVNATLATKWDYQTQGAWAMQGGPSDATLIQCYVATSITDAGTTTAATATGAFSAAAWHRVGFVFDGTQAGNAGRWQIFVDGKAKALSFAGTIPATLTNATSDVRFGQWGGTLSRPWNGLIDDMAIWTRALSIAEMADDYNLSRLGYPGVLNRVAPRLEKVPPPVFVAFPKALYIPQQSLPLLDRLTG